MSESFVVELRVSCFGEKTSRCFVENEPSFWEKQAVVLWKVENGWEGIEKRWKRRLGEMEFLWERMGSEHIVLRNVKWWMRESSRARVHTHVYRSFCVFAVTSVTVIYVTDWNIVEYVVLLGFVCFWRVEIKKRGWKIDGDVEVRSSRFSQSFWGGVWHLWQQKKLNRCWKARAYAREVPLVLFLIKSVYSVELRLQNRVHIKFSCQFLADLQLFGCISFHIF